MKETCYRLQAHNEYGERRKNDGTTSKITTQWSDKIPVKCRNENQLQKNVKPSYLSLFGRIYQWYCNDFR